MADLDADAVLSLGGWDPRYVRVLFVAQTDNRALALVDADSDLNLDGFELDGTGGWRPASSMAVDESGPGLLGGVAYHYGQEPAGTEVLVAYAGVEHSVTTGSDGWWVFIAPGDENQHTALPVRR